MRSTCPLWISFCLLLPSLAAAQERPRSFADSQVRHALESHAVALPQLPDGDAIGGTPGPRGLLLRRADGHLEVLRLDSDENSAAPERVLPVPPAAVEAVEEVEVAAGAPVEIAAAKPVTAPMAIQLQRGADGLLVKVLEGRVLSQGEAIDRVAVRRGLLQSRPKGGDRTLQMTMKADVTLQDLLSVWNEARAAGYHSVYLTSVAAPSITADDREKITEVPAELGWHKSESAVTYDGELLLLFPASTMWHELAPVLMECARVGIWRLGFVAKGAEHARVVVPMHLPL